MKQYRAIEVLRSHINPKRIYARENELLQLISNCGSALILLTESGERIPANILSVKEITDEASHTTVTPGSLLNINIQCERLQSMEATQPGTASGNDNIPKEPIKVHTQRTEERSTQPFLPKQKPGKTAARKQPTQTALF